MLTRILAYLRRHLWIPAAGAVVIAAAVIVPVVTAGPSYPHAWCGETLNAMYDSGHHSFGDFMNMLRSAQNDGAPTDNLISDEDSLSQDYASANSALASDALDILAAEQADMTSIGNDAKAINRACGLPSNYKIGRLAVPASD